MYIFILIADNNKDLTKYIETPFTLKSRQVLPSDFFFCFSYGKLRYVFGIYNSIKYYVYRAFYGFIISHFFADIL